MVEAVVWPADKTHISRRSDVEMLFGRHAPQLSEIFWEAVQWILHLLGHVISSLLEKSFITERAELLPHIICGSVRGDKPNADVAHRFHRRDPHMCCASVRQ